MNSAIVAGAIDTPLGAMTAAVKDDALIGLWFIGQKHYPAEAARWPCKPGHPVLQALGRYLANYFVGKGDALDVRLAPSGSSFQKMVWDALLQIPMGEVVTYGEIARYIARARGMASMSAQAVGGAVGRNRISILIPCHRVVGADGNLTGYAGGLDRKAALLQLEKVNPARIGSGQSGRNS